MTTAEIAQAIKQNIGCEIDKKKISLDKDIKILENIPLALSSSEGFGRAYGRSRRIANRFGKNCLKDE